MGQAAQGSGRITVLWSVQNHVDTESQNHRYGVVLRDMVQDEPVSAGLVAGLDDLKGLFLYVSMINCPWLEAKDTLDKEDLGTHLTGHSHGNYEMKCCLYSQ